jgi:hypothetical protein
VWTLGKWKPSWKPGELGDPARQEGEKADSWHQTVEEDRHHKMPQNIGDRLTTTPSHVYAQSMCNCALCINYHINNHNRNRVFLYYLFQENKSFGSKKPFAFILWCAGSCVEHMASPCIVTTVTGVCNAVWRYLNRYTAGALISVWLVMNLYCI